MRASPFTDFTDYFKDFFETAVTINEEIMKIDNNIDIPYINIGNYYLLKFDTATVVLYWEKPLKNILRIIV